MFVRSCNQIGGEETQEDDREGRVQEHGARGRGAPRDVAFNALETSMMSLTDGGRW